LREKYNKKRKFSNTPEPVGQVTDVKNGSKVFTICRANVAVRANYNNIILIILTSRRRCVIGIEGKITKTFFLITE